MKRIILLALACFALSLQANIYYNVKDFGAKGDGIHIDSDAINEAIKSASANGGGTIFFPSGTYASFSIRLESNITLYLDAGSTILAAYPEKDRGYDLAEENAHNLYQDFGHSHWKNSLIWGIGLENASYQRDEPQAPDHGYVTGRIKFGTESSGGFKNISITNCIFERCRGLALETVDGGHLEDVVINNITMKDIVNAPIFLRLGSRLRSPKGTPVGKISRVSISNINVYNADSQYACIIAGIPDHQIEDVTLSNININFKGGGTKEDGARIPPENANLYPEPWMFGTIPASAFFIRHAKNIELNNIKISHQMPDFRPPLWMEDVDSVRIINFRTPIEKNVEPYKLSDVTNFNVYISDFE